MSSGKKSRPCFPSPRPRCGVVPNRSPIVPVSRGFCGYCAQEPAGKICPSDIPHRVPAGDAYGTGKNRTSGSKRGGLFWANSISLKYSLMAALPRRKKGACVGKTKRGKGTKWMVVVDGEGVPVGNLLDAA